MAAAGRFASNKDLVSSKNTVRVESFLHVYLINEVNFIFLHTK